MEKTEIYRKIRGIYGLSRTGMSRVLGFGVNQWGLYEVGGVEPSRSNELLIEMVKDPRGMLKLLEKNAGILSSDDWGIGMKRYGELVSRVKEILRGYEEKEGKVYAEWVEGLYQ